MNSAISIPDPCHENWNAMQPEDQGRHCPACATTVTDFTAWAPEDIVTYLRINAATKTCGRFRKEQLTEQPASVNLYDLAENIHAAAISFTKKIAILILIVVGMSTASCSNETIGKAIVSDPKLPEIEKCETDSIIFMGAVRVEDQD